MNERCTLTGLDSSYIQQRLLNELTAKTKLLLDDTFSLSNDEFIKQIYRRLLNAEPEIKIYHKYLSLLEKNRMSKEAFIYLVYSSQNCDREKIIIDNIENYAEAYKNFSLVENYNGGLSEYLLNLPQEEFIRRIYEDLLNREADISGKKALFNALMAGLPREEVVWTVCSSSEYQQNKKGKIDLKYYAAWHKFYEYVKAHRTLNNKFVYPIAMYFSKYFI